MTISSVEKTGGVSMRKSVSRRDVLAMAAGGLGAALVAGPLARASAAEQQVTLYVFRGEQGIKGPDGKGHDAFVPSSFVVKAGVPVHLVIINYDEGPHTITAPDLGLNILVNPGKTVGSNVEPVTTTASFTTSKRGPHRWYCAMACDAGGGGWAMQQGYAGPDKEGFMAGYIVVL
jgi:plastocyanin